MNCPAASSSSRRFLITVVLQLIAATTTVAVLTTSAIGAPKKRGRPHVYTKKTEELAVPENLHPLGSLSEHRVTPNDMNNGKAPFPKFHDVYIGTGQFRRIQQDRQIPRRHYSHQGACLSWAKSAASGNGYFPGEFLEVEAVVKDSKRFAKEPGNWAYFKFMGADGKPLDKAKMQPTENCNGCHEKNAAEDWVFTQFYPVLRAAKAAK